MRIKNIYNTGCYYSELSSGYPLEIDFLKGFDNGRLDGKPLENPYGYKGGVLKTQRIISVMHEAQHYLDDLTSGTCLNYDILSDESYAYLYSFIQSLSKNYTLTCPILNNNNINPRLTYFLSDNSLFLVSKLISTTNEMDELLYTKLNFDTIKYDYQKHVKWNNFHFCGIDLLESLASAKVLSSLTHYRSRTKEDQVYLFNIQDKLQILPDKQSNPKNRNSKIIFENFTNIMGYAENRNSYTWPYDYLDFNGAPSVNLYGFIYCCLIALNIPPWYKCKERIESGLNSIEDFLPTNRFFLILNALKEFGGFPEAPKDHEDFFPLIFNKIAKFNRNNWPTWEETNLDWLNHHNYMVFNRKSVSDGLKLRLSSDIAAHPTRFTAIDTINYLVSHGIQLVFRTPNSFKSIYSVNLKCEDPFEHFCYIYPIETKDLDLSLINEKCNPFGVTKKPFIDTSGLSEEQFQNLILIEIQKEEDRTRTFTQEVIFRTFAKSLKHSILYSSKLICPFLDNATCKHKTSVCAELLSFEMFPSQDCHYLKFLTIKGIVNKNLKWKKD